MEIAIVLSAIVEVILLICFINLTNNVNKIREKIDPVEDVWAKVYFLLSIGEQQKARDLYIKSILNDEIIFSGHDIKTAKEKMDRVKFQYGEGLKNLGFSLPD